MVSKLEGPDAREIAEWEQRFKFCQEQRRGYEDQWYTNLAMYGGRQWALWRKTVTGGNRLIDPPAPRNRVRVVTNKIRTYIRKEHAKLTKQEPIWYVTPNTTEPDDVMAARAAEGLTSFILQESDFSARRQTATFWMCLTGTGYLKETCPDINAPIEIAAPPTFHIFVPDLQEEEIEAQTYVIHARALSVDTVYQAYRVMVNADVTAGGGTLEQKFFTALGMRQESTVSRNLAYVKEIWVKPGKMKQYPNGALLVICDNKIIYRYTNEVPEDAGPMDEEIPSNVPDVYPYEHGEYPFQKLSHIPTGMYYGDSTIKDLISPQREYNKTRSQMIENKNRTSKPPLVYPQGALNPKLVTSEPGQMIPIKTGFNIADVRYLEAPNVPVHMEELSVLNSDMDFVASQSEVSRGGAPTGVEASSAIAFLNEQNDTTLFTTVSNLERAIQKAGKQCLSLAQQYWDEEKVIKIVSKDVALDAQVFKISDINGNTDLRIETGSIAPQSQAAKQAFILGLVDRGFPLEEALKYLEMNETNRMYSNLQADSRQAQRENHLMKVQTVEPAPVEPSQPQMQLDPFIAQAMGQAPQATTPTEDQPVEPQPNVKPFPINPFDNHKVHMEEHGLFMKSNEYELLDPAIKAVMLQHWLQHQQQMEMDLARAAGFGQPQSGPPAETGAGTDPGNPAG